MALERLPFISIQNQSQLRYGILALGQACHLDSMVIICLPSDGIIGDLLTASLKNKVWQFQLCMCFGLL
jgi:hypothetical protein